MRTTIKSRIAAAAIAAAIAAIVGYGYGIYENRNGGTDAPNAAISDHAKPFLEALDTIPTSNSLSASEYERLSNLGGDVLSIKIGEIVDTGTYTEAHDVVISLAEFEETGISIDRVRVWGADIDGIEALVRGDVSQDVQLATRFDAEGLQYFGFEALMQKMNDEMTSAMVETITDIETDIGEEIASTIEPTTIDRYEFSVARLLVENAQFHAFEGFAASPEESAGRADDFWDIAQAMASIYRGFSVDTFVWTDMIAEMAMTDNLMTMEMTFAAPLLATRGYSRGDIEFSLSEDFSVNVEMSGQEMSEEFPIEKLSIGVAFQSSTIEDFRMANLLGHLAQRQLPPMEETDILSGGIWTIDGFEYRLQGSEPFYSIDTSTLDLSQFHWLIPTKVAYSVRGEQFDFSVLADSFLPFLTEAATDDGIDTGEVSEIVTDVITILTKYDLEKLIFDGDFTYEWSPETGATSFVSDGQLKDFGGLQIQAIGTLPAYSAFLSQGDAFKAEEVFAQFSSLTSARINLIDKGGIDKSFALAVDLSKYIPDANNSPQLQMVKQSNPKQLKDGLAALINITGMAAKEDFPPVVDYTSALANFLLKGGTMSGSITPEQPLSVELFSTIEIEEPNPSPDRIVEILGIEVTHTAPVE